MEWTKYRVALLTAGIRWDAVRVPYDLLHPTFNGDTEPDALRQRLEQLPVVGPAFCDPYRPFMYFLVPPGTDKGWPLDLVPAGVEILGGTEPYVRHVGVPSLSQIRRPGPFWVHPLDRGARWHVDPQHLYAVLHALVNETAAQSEASGGTS